MTGSAEWREIDFNFPYLGRAAGVAERLWCATILKGEEADEWVVEMLYHRVPGQISDPVHDEEGDW